MLPAVTGEFFGTMMLIILGNGVNANVVLNKTKGNNSGWIVIAFGWAMAVFIGVYISTRLGGSGHLNPAVTIAMTAFDGFDKSLAIPYILAQFAGAIAGAIINWIAHKQHFDITDDKDLKLVVFCNAPAIKGKGYNMATEIIGTFILVFGAMAMSPAATTLGTLDALPVGLLVLGIGLSLGGPTGYAINPARDLGPRIAHFILPIKDKRDSDWGYSWIPVVGPVIGGLLAAYIFKLL
ncbi:MAG: MIP family channel protein [Terrimonas sp.]|nr:MIP family channel protein [Terrimonas sp.]